MKSKSVIIPAAGLATRMKPLSKGISKAMIPVNGRPLISYIIEHIIKDDPECEIVIVENELRDIREFVKRVYPSSNIKTVVQKSKEGPLHAIYIGWSLLERLDSPITVWLGDTICLDSLPYEQDFLAVYPVIDPHRWCLIDNDGNLYDKPTNAYEVPTDKALVGVYNFVNREFFNAAIVAGMQQPTHKGEHQIAALLSKYMQKQKMSLVCVNEWYDCGELTTYYDSKAKLLKRTARSFNSIEVDTFFNTVKKSSIDPEKQRKIEDEKQWYLKLSPLQSQFIPRVLPSETGELVMSLEPGIALNEVIVYDNLRLDVWNSLIRKIFKIHHEVFKTQTTLSAEQIEDDCYQSYIVKNMNRMNNDISKTMVEFGVTEEEIDFVKSFVESTGLELCKNPTKHWSAVMHGDSHLGNIIYDAYSGSIKFVDPRGSFGFIKGTEGDLRYDMAKLLQDFYCGYSMMMADRYKTYINGDRGKTEINWADDTSKILEILETLLIKEGYDLILLKKLSVVLLITAIPFHKDNKQRQLAFWRRGVYLIQDLYPIAIIK